METQVKVSELLKNTDGVDERILLELHPYVTTKITKRGPGGCEGGGGRCVKEYRMGRVGRLEKKKRHEAKN